MKTSTRAASIALSLLEIASLSRRAHRYVGAREYALEHRIRRDARSGSPGAMTALVGVRALRTVRNQVRPPPVTVARMELRPGEAFEIRELPPEPLGRKARKAAKKTKKAEKTARKTAKREARTGAKAAAP